MQVNTNSSFFVCVCFFFFFFFFFFFSVMCDLNHILFFYLFLICSFQTS